MRPLLHELETHNQRHMEHRSGRVATWLHDGGCVAAELAAALALGEGRTLCQGSTITQSCHDHETTHTLAQLNALNIEASGLRLLRSRSSSSMPNVTEASPWHARATDGVAGQTRVCGLRTRLLLGRGARVHSFSFGPRSFSVPSSAEAVRFFPLSFSAPCGRVSHGKRPVISSRSLLSSVAAAEVEAGR